MKRKKAPKPSGKSENTTRVTLISHTAKKIRKKGEPWNKAIQRATKVLQRQGALNGTLPSKKTIKYNLQGVKGQFKPNLIPEIKLSFSVGKRILGKAGSPKEIATFVRKQFRKGSIELEENFYVTYLNNKNQIIGYHHHSKGGVSGTVIDPRIIFAIALKSLATRIILAHNHPGGNLKASKGDIEETKRIKAIGELHKIELLDHIIITKDDYLSFATEDLL